MKTEGFNLSDSIIKRLEKHGITNATPIQKQIIPAITEGRDVLAQSETGSGKTLSFAIPIIENVKRNNGVQALVLVPTRELCKQIADEFFKFSEKGFFTEAVYGGVSIQNQLRNIKKSKVVVATPGRLLDIVQRKGINFKDLKYLVLDEADRMLDMGFITDIEKITKSIPEKKQTLLFSATISKEIAGLSKKYLENPVKVHLESTVKPGFLNQTYYRVAHKEKLLMLIHLLRKEDDLVIVFCNRKDTTEHLAKELSTAGLQAKALNGDMSQDKRERITKQFKQKRFNILIATDVASRGLHIEDVMHIYNYEIPREIDSYTHRVGRTARAGKKGNAISFVSTREDEKFFKQILFEHKGNIALISSADIGFKELEKNLPDTKSKSKNRSGRKPEKASVRTRKYEIEPRKDFSENRRDKKQKEAGADYTTPKKYPREEMERKDKRNEKSEGRKNRGGDDYATRKKYSREDRERKSSRSERINDKKGNSPRDKYKDRNKRQEFGKDEKKFKHRHLQMPEKESEAERTKSFWKRFLAERNLPFTKNKKKY